MQFRMNCRARIQFAKTYITPNRKTNILGSVSKMENLFILDKLKWWSITDRYSLWGKFIAIATYTYKYKNPVIHNATTVLSCPVLSCPEMAARSSDSPFSMIRALHFKSRVWYVPRKLIFNPLDLFIGYALSGRSRKKPFSVGKAVSPLL